MIRNLLEQLIILPMELLNNIDYRWTITFVTVLFIFMSVIIYDETIWIESADVVYVDKCLSRQK